MKYIFAFFIGLPLFFFNLSPSVSQTKKIDSLENELKKAIHDTSKVNTLNSLAWEYRKNNHEKALDYLEQAFALSEKLTFTKGKGNTYSRTGDIYYSSGKYNKAEEYYYKALAIKREMGDQKGIAKSLNNIGDVNLNLGNYKQAIDNYLESIKICKLIADQKLMFMPLNNIAVCYFYLANYEKALEYYVKALEVAENWENKKLLVNPSLGLGNVYKAMGNNKKALIYYKQALKISKEMQFVPGIYKSLNNIGIVYDNLNNVDTALIYNQEALKIAEAGNDQQEIALSLINVGNIYHKTKNHLKALEYYQKALLINQETRNKDGCAKSLLNIGVIYSEIGNVEKAEEYLKQALIMADLINSKEVIMEGNEELSTVYFKKGDYKNAYTYYKNFISLKDSILNETNTKNIAEIETKYETEKKEREIERLTKDKQLKEAQLESQKNLRNVFIVGIGLLLLLILLAYNRYLIKQKANKEIAQKNKEITESISYAKRIQSSFLTSERYISQRLSDYFIFYNPRNIVSGDFYWLMEKNNNLYVCTADCTGHGIPGAFMSLISMGILNEIIYSKTHIKHTDEILNELRRIVILAVNPEGSLEEGKDGMDAVLCRFDFQKMELEYSAANNSFFIIRNGELLVFKPDKMPVGKHIGVEKPFTRTVIPIEKGDCIYTFSDGYADQFGGPEGKKFQSKRLKELFLSHCHKPMKVQKEIYARTIKEWQGDNEQVDDMLMMGIRV